MLTDQQQRCHQAFKISNYTEQKDINPRRAEGTCQWARQSPQYVRWEESCCNDLLWLSADPGCGKSVLAKSIIDDYLQASSSAIIICYFFFKDNDEQNTLATALCAILHQLFSQRPNLLYHALPSWEKNGERIRQEVDELWRIFITATSAEPSCKTICILDALDECYEGDQRRLIEKLKYIHHQPRSSVNDTWLKFLVTSRPYNHIQHHLDSFSNIHLKGEEENDQIHKEIDLVVKARVRELARTAHLSSDIHEQLEQKLLQMEHRTYLWLHLAIDDIQSTFENSFRPADESIPLISPSVNAAYEKLLNRVPPTQVDKVTKILQIIIAARRPLTTQEMAMALGIATSPESRTAAEAEIDPGRLERYLRHWCGLFVFTNKSKIYLIHQTAREFLIGKKTTSQPNPAYWWSLKDPEEQMAHVCLRYLLMDDLENNEVRRCFEPRSFLEYSAVYWSDHVRCMSWTDDGKVNNLLNQLYNTTTKQFSLWFPIFWRAMTTHDSFPTMNPIHLASINGHQQVVCRLLAEDESNINTADGTGTYPLIWASWYGHYGVVHLILNHGADVNAMGGIYGNALQAACFRGHEKIAQMLLDHGAEVNAQGGDYDNALFAACFKGHTMIVWMLLEHGADINFQGENYGNALQTSCFEGHDKIVRMLLKYGADVNSQGGDYGSPLQAACVRGNDKIVQMLLECGAEVNAQSVRYNNPLQTACFKGDDKIVQMLLEHRADIKAQGGFFSDALQAACFGGHVKIVQMLQNIVARSTSYRSPFKRRKTS